MATHLAVQRELVIRKTSIGFIKEEVSTDDFLEPPILPLDKAILHTRDREGSRSSNMCTHKYTPAHTYIHVMYTHTHTYTQPHHSRWQQLLTPITPTHSTNAQSFSHPLPCVFPSCCLGWRILNLARTSRHAYSDVLNVETLPMGLVHVVLPLSFQ